MSCFSIINLPLSSLKMVERKRLSDSRGFFSRLFCSEELNAVGWHRPIFQINYTYTARKSTVRGLHFQHPPYAEMKLVSVIRGEVWDVAIDLRKESPTFLHWHAEHLSAENSRALLIPEGFAHGFQTLTDNVELIYCHSMPYNAEAEAGLNPKDTKLAIPWPLTISEISQRDQKHPMLNPGFMGVTIE